MELSDMLMDAAPKFSETDKAQKYILALKEISVDLPEGSYRKKEMRKFLGRYIPEVKHAESLRRIWEAEERLRKSLRK